MVLLRPLKQSVCSTKSVLSKGQSHKTCDSLVQREQSVREYTMGNNPMLARRYTR